MPERKIGILKTLPKPNKFGFIAIVDFLIILKKESVTAEGNVIRQYLEMKNAFPIYCFVLTEIYHATG